MARFCTNCGTEIPDGIAFCTECGTKAPATVQPGIEPKQPLNEETNATAAVQMNENVAPTSAQTPPPQQQTYQAPPPQPQSYQAPPQPPCQPQQNYQQPYQQQNHNSPAQPGELTDAEVKGTKYEPISAWGYIGILLLMCIPLVGLIFTIVWACGGCRKISKRSLARATLIMTAIALVLALIIALAGGALINSLLDMAGIETSENGALFGGSVSAEEDKSDEPGGLMGLFGGSLSVEDDEGKEPSGLMGLFGGASSVEDNANEAQGGFADIFGGLFSVEDGGNEGSGGLTGLFGGEESLGGSASEGLGELGAIFGALEALGGLTAGGGDLSGLEGLFGDIEDINREAEAQNDGWPASLRQYPGGTSKEVASYRTIIENTSAEEMKGWINSLKSDGYVYTDFYDFGMSEADMLSSGGWWGTNGEYYVSVSYYDGAVTVDHLTELPDSLAYIN